MLHSVQRRQNSKPILATSLPGRGEKHCDQHVCLSVCLSAEISQTFCTLPAAVAGSFANDNAISYVLPALWMTSRFHLMAPVG